MDKVLLLNYLTLFSDCCKIFKACFYPVVLLSGAFRLGHEWFVGIGNDNGSAAVETKLLLTK